jgi:hypothetical protein
MRFRALCSLGVVSAILSTCAFAATADRITEAISTGQMVKLTGNTHSLAKPEFDLGRVDGGRTLYGVTLGFRLSAQQQQDLDLIISQLQVPGTPNYHKFLTVAQYADRFGLSLNDLNRIAAWLRAEGFTNISVSNNHNEISFDGTVAQVEHTFQVEMHHYLVDGQVHLANSSDPSVPAALAGVALSIRHLHNFSPKPQVRVRPNLTSYVSGNHFLTPGDFAVIYDINNLYTAGSDGTGQTIAIIGQSTVNTNDLNNFRTNSGLPTSTVTMTLMEGTATRCSGDELESDLDLEWSGGVAKNASINFVFAGLGPGDTCASRSDSSWDALNYAVTSSSHGVAPFISTSYGFCEAGNGESFAQTVDGWAQEAVTQGQTIVAASGDEGAADCDPGTAQSATMGLAVNLPASSPSVTGAGGNEFTGDESECPQTGCTGNTAPADPPYWAGSGNGSDVVVTALEYIPEEAWNDTTEAIADGLGLSASGGGASLYFTKPSWQTGLGVPADGKRDVPDIAITASDFHDPYLICSEDNGEGGIQPSCVSGFRSSAGGDFTAVGGTSAAAPTFTAIMALVNQYMGNTPPTGLAPINETLYTLPGNNPAPFHDVTTGNNIVPCTTGTPDCTSGTFGFSAGPGYDQVTGLGSVDAYNLAQIWARTPTTTTVSANPSSVNLGASVTFTATVSPSTATGTVNFYNVGSTTSIGSGTVSSGTATFTTTALPSGTNSVTAVYSGDTADRLSTSTTPAVVTVMPPSFTLTSNLSGGTLQVAQGSSGSATFTVNSSNGFLTGTSPNQTTILPVTYTCSDPAPQSTCTGPTSATTATSVSFTIQTTAASARLQLPFERGSRIFYAALLPGLLGIMFTVGSRKRSLGGMRMIGLIVALGFSTLWLGSCSGSNSSSSSQGTTPGNYMITINATTGGVTPVTSSATFTLNVTAAAK